MLLSHFEDEKTEEQRGTVTCWRALRIKEMHGNSNLCQNVLTISYPWCPPPLLVLWVLQGSGARWQPCGLLRQGRLQQAVAPYLLCVCQVLWATGGPHLLLEGRCTLVWPPLLREPAAPVLWLRWGESRGWGEVWAVRWVLPLLWERTQRPGWVWLHWECDPQIGKLRLRAHVLRSTSVSSFAKWGRNLFTRMGLFGMGRTHRSCQVWSLAQCPALSKYSAEHDGGRGVPESRLPTFRPGSAQLVVWLPDSRASVYHS